MIIVIGLILIISSIAFALYMVKKIDKTILEMKFMKTSKLKDCFEIIQEMIKADPNYHHYAELKGNIFTKKEVIAPYSQRNVAYYQNECYLVTEEIVTIRDSKGNIRRKRVKNETLLSDEKSFEPVYFQDDINLDNVLVDIESFGNDLELKESYDQISKENKGFPNHYAYSKGFLGYRLKEKSLNQNQSVYILGDIYFNNGHYHICKNNFDKISCLSYRSEEDVIAQLKNKKMMTLIIALIVIIIGIALIIYNFELH